MAPILKVEDINVYYGSIHAIKGISFEVNQGEIVTLIGANGAGKSTTLNTVAGLLTSRTGYVEFDGNEEIDEDKNFRNFNYRLVMGDYPKLIYQDGKVTEESLFKVAISTYLADSILYFLNGEQLNEQDVATYEDLLNKKSYCALCHQ